MANDIKLILEYKIEKKPKTEKQIRKIQQIISVDCGEKKIEGNRMKNC